MDAQKKLGPKDYAAWLHAQLPPLLTLDKLTEDPAIHHIGRFKFSNFQLQYVLVNFAYHKSINTVHEMGLIMRCKWPKQFALLLESDLEMVSQWLCHNPPALP